MARIVLIRPGRTEFDEQRRIQGTLDLPLSTDGVADVDRMIEELTTMTLDVVYTSPCQAACETAERLAGAQSVKMKELDRLQNLNHGLWQGRCVEEVRQTQPTVYRQWQENPESICPPGGEAVTTACERIRAAAAKLLRKHERDTIAIVAPEPLFSLLRCELAGGVPRDLWCQTRNGKLWEVVEVGQSHLAPTG